MNLCVTNDHGYLKWDTFVASFANTCHRCFIQKSQKFFSQFTCSTCSTNPDGSGAIVRESFLILNSGIGYGIRGVLHCGEYS
ncbi:hypothetical protein DSL72_006177 [Monilinia vaccinii-corymbosi]|uniref:Uncharacterized protein n=1 Tax=Monilinia vaccinii-corymbosi TaxID=61207 RepID=A0A8A3PHS1_9HELO|nr:hypothetical protein DSL72_006177 [Monilinia vaccinii-corymbosi]